MPTKIDRNSVPPAQAPRISSAPQATPVAREEGSRSTAPAASFNAPALPDPGPLSPRGTHVPTTAEPGALWGERPSRHFDREAFARLPPAEREARVAEWEARRGELSHRIHDRVGSLDHRWRYMRVANKVRVIRAYQRKSRALDPETRAKVDVPLARAEAAQRKIDALQARVDRLSRGPGQTALRNQLAAELKAAREEQSAAVAQAVKIIDDKGLKVDRLAETEQLIDPNAPPEGSGSSLLDTVYSWFQLSWQLFSAVTHVELSRTQDKQKKQERQLEAERLLDDRARNDMLRQRLNEELATRRRLGSD